MKNSNEEKYIPINKGHFELDTPERIKEFHKNLLQVGSKSMRSIEDYG